MSFIKIFPFFVGVFVALLITGGTILYAAWSEPTSTPPTCNTGSPGCDVPIHTGGAQTKGGDLNIESGYYSRLHVISDNYWAGIELVARELVTAGNPHIDFTHDSSGTVNFGIRISAPSNDELSIEGGQTRLETVQITGGSPSNGEVLTATDSSGNATWAAPGSPSVDTRGASSGGYIYNGSSRSATATCASNEVRVGCSGGLHRWRDSAENWNYNFQVSQLRTYPVSNGCRTTAMRNGSEQWYRVYVYAYCLNK